MVTQTEGRIGGGGGGGGGMCGGGDDDKQYVYTHYPD